MSFEDIAMESMSSKYNMSIDNNNNNNNKNINNSEWVNFDNFPDFV